MFRSRNSENKSPDHHWWSNSKAAVLSHCLPKYHSFQATVWYLAANCMAAWFPQRHPPSSFGLCNQESAKLGSAPTASSNSVFTSSNRRYSGLDLWNLNEFSFQWWQKLPFYLICEQWICQRGGTRQLEENQSLFCKTNMLVAPNFLS